jgi:hypothetical protein
MMKLGFSENHLNTNKNGHKRVGLLGLPRNCLGDLTSGHGFDNGCMCFEPMFNDLKSTGGGCVCGVSKVVNFLIESIK